MKLFAVIFFICMIFPLCRCIVKNLHLIGIYSVVDAYLYFKFKKWQEFDLFGIDMFIGMFGHGKTLSMTHRARLIYNKFGDSVRFISNYNLVGIPYIELINFNQLVDLGEEEKEKYIGTVVLIDEIENILNNRNYSKFPLPLLHMLTQQRKKKLYIMCSAQRFFMVDKLFRSITNHVFNCNKYWRFQHVEVYDAWDLEQAMNYRDIKRIANKWWFVKNQDYNAYDTSQMIQKNSAENFISNEETIVRLGDSAQNLGAVRHYSKRFRKDIRQNKKKR